VNVAALLRPATPADRATVFAWRNDPFIVSLSASRRTVTWDEHAAWYDRVVTGERHLLLIVEREGEGIGTVRFDREGEAGALVTIYLLEPFVGRGLGTPVLREACGRAFVRWPEVGHLEARIQAGNARSVRALEKAGFRQVETSVDAAEVRMEMRR
jgi:RimJ/RimL family protein N-acetyltransferase